MEYDGIVSMFWAAPAVAVVLGIVIGVVLVLPLVLIVVHLAFTTLVGATIDALRARHRQTRESPRSREKASDGRLVAEAGGRKARSTTV